MQSIYVPKYDIHYRINPKNPCELQWSKKPFGPMTAWQKAFTFTKPIRALDIDDDTQQGVVVLNDSSTYVGSGVRVWGRKYYTAGSRLYSLYAIGESKMQKMKITVHESKMSAGMARSILNGSVEGDKEDARRNLNRLYSEWVVKFKTKDGKPYTMKISGAEDEADAWKQAVAYAERNGNGDKIDKTAPLSIDYIQKWESVKKNTLKIRMHENVSESYSPKSKRIGRYIWSLENLNIDDGGVGIYTNPDTGEVFYTYDAAKRVAGNIPGWHLPSPDEWYDLEDVLIDTLECDHIPASREFEVTSYTECSNIGSYDEPNLEFYTNSDVTFWSNKLPIVAAVIEDEYLEVISLGRDTYDNLRNEGKPVRLVKG